MAKFLEGNKLNVELENILENAEEILILITPFIRLHDRYASILKTKLEDYDLRIVVVFGKNEDNLSKSFKPEDFHFFKKFTNIEIRYEKRLHAKYYANESHAIISSMNLYSYSQDNNIEVGVLTKSTLLSIVPGADGLDQEAAIYFERVINQSELLYKTEPILERGMMGFKKSLKGENVLVDKLSEFLKNPSKFEKTKKEKNSKKLETKNKKVGYCIRTGEEIPFNLEKPLSYKAYQAWAKYKDSDYPEKYCHFSGEESNKKTSVAKPILKKYWTKAKKIHGL